MLAESTTLHNEYGSGTLRVVPFEAKVTAASRALEAFPVGAAFEITGKFKEYPSSVIGDGIFGLSPSGATLALSKMGLGNDARQFLFDASHEKLSLEQLDPADPAFRWLDGAVRVYSELVDYWVIPDSLSSVGPAVVDTGATDIFLSDDQVEAYFASYPEGTYMKDEGDDLIACDDTESLPRLEILLGKEESEESVAPEEPRIDCGLSAQQLRANLALTTSAGKRFCYTSLQRMSTAGDEDGHGALLG